MKLWKFDSGIYPVIPGMDIALGDYGYWQDSQWCRVGNIEQLPNCPKVFSRKRQPLNQSVSESLEVDFKGENIANLDVLDLKAGGEMFFKKKNSQIFIGDLKECIYYSSIDMEISPFLCLLSERGLWKTEYWLAYYVVYSDKFLTMRSKSAGASVKINADLSLRDLQDVKTGLTDKLSFKKDSVESVTNKEDELTFAGAKFISLRKGGLFRRDVKVKYNSVDTDEILLV